MVIFELQLGEYVFDHPLGNYDNRLLVVRVTTYDFTHLITRKVNSNNAVKKIRMFSREKINFKMPRVTSRNTMGACVPMLSVFFDPM